MSKEDIVMKQGAYLLIALFLITLIAFSCYLGVGLGVFLAVVMATFVACCVFYVSYIEY